MSNAAKGLGLLLLVVAVALGGWWLMADHSPAPIVALKGAGGGNARGEGDFATPAPVDAARADGLAAERATDAAPAVEAPVAAPTSTLPTAEFLTGVVVDTQGRPVAGADVRWGWPEFGALNRARAARDARGGRGRRGGRGPFMRLGQLDAAQVAPNVVKSGADGTFRLPNVTRADGLELRVDHPDYVVLARSDLVLPTAGLDVGRLTLEPGGTVVGFVYGPGGAKQVGATVTLADAPDDDNNRGFFRFSFGDRGMRHATTDEEGRFRLTGMPPGKAVVEATAEGLCDATSSPIEVVARQVAGEVVLHLERGFELKGVVKDAAGKPVDGAEIHATDRNDFARMMRSGGEPDAISDEQGRYLISGLKAGVYDVSASAEGHARAEHPNIDPAQVATLDITLGATLHVAGRVVLKGSSETPTAVKVQLVPHFGDDNNMAMPFFDMDDAENVAKEDGRFQVEGIEPGDYRVVARAAGTTRGRSAPIKIEAGKSIDDVVVEVERGAIVEGRILDPSGAPVANADVRAFEPTPPPGNDPNGAVSFTAGMRIGGRGFRPGRMGFDGRRNAGRAKSDADGRYAIEHLAAGRFELEVSHADFATQRTDATEVAAAERKGGVDVRLGRGGTVEGTIVGIDGSPRASDRVHVQSKSVANVRLDAVSDANGYYRVDHVPAGEAIVSREEPEENRRGGGDFVFVMAGGAAEEEQGKSVLVEEEKTARVDFSQVEKPVLEGIVTCADGPVAGATVSASPNAGGGNELRGFFGGGNRKEATTGADGRYRIADLDAGKWRVSVRHPQGLVPTTAEVTLQDRGTARQDFALEGGVIAGVATELGGKAGIEGASVRLEAVASQDGGGGGAPVVMGEMAISLSPGRGTRGRTMRFGGGDPGARVTTARDGSFRIPWVPAGKYKINVSHDGHLAASSEPFDVAANGNVDGVKVELPPAARLKVHVRSKQTGQPVEGSVLQLTMEPEGRDFGYTDGDGVASFESLKPGTWSIQPRDGFRGGRGNDDAAAAPPTTVTCEAGKLAEITIDV